MVAATSYKELNLHPDVIYYDEMRRYSPGIKVEKNGRFTQRIVVDRQYYASEAEAEERSRTLGKRLIDKHLISNDVLYFDYPE